MLPNLQLLYYLHVNNYKQNINAYNILAPISIQISKTVTTGELNKFLLLYYNLEPQIFTSMAHKQALALIIARIQAKQQDTWENHMINHLRYIKLTLNYGNRPQEQNVMKPFSPG